MSQTRRLERLTETALSSPVSRLSGLGRAQYHRFLFNGVLDEGAIFDLEGLEDGWKSHQSHVPEDSLQSKS